MNYRLIPGTLEVIISIEPGDLVALVDAFNEQNILSPFYDFPETGLIEIEWDGPLVHAYMAVFDEATGDILVKLPTTHALTLTRGDVLRFYQPNV